MSRKRPVEPLRPKRSVALGYTAALSFPLRYIRPDQKPKNGRRVHRRERFQCTFKGKLVSCEKLGRGNKNGPCPQPAMEAMKEMAHGPETRAAGH